MRMRKQAATGGEADDTVRLWRRGAPDLAPPELWVGDREH